MIERIALSLPCWLLLTAVAGAHDSPGHVIERLTLKMERQGRTAELLYQRATEYRTLGKLDRAAHDLQSALRKSPKHFGARLELSRIQLAQGDADLALATIDEALRHANDRERPVALIQRSTALLAEGRAEQAIVDANEAIAARPGQVDWYLQRSAAYDQLGEKIELAESLEAGWRATQSGALKVAWVDALIDAGQADEALKQVEPELADARFASSWLIRRARCRFQLGAEDQARQDLRRAIDEINPRIRPERPDASLIADRGLAHLLLGKVDLAKTDLQLAQAQRADASVTERLERAIGMSSAEPGPQSGE